MINRGHYPANTSTLIQRWNNVDRQRSSTLFRRWYLVENESWADVHLSTLFKITFKQRWKNYVSSTSLKQRCFNVEIWLKMKVEPTHVCRRCFNVDKTRWNNTERITLIQCRYINVVSTFIFGWKWKLSLFIGVASTLRKQHWNNFANICCTDH